MTYTAESFELDFNHSEDNLHQIFPVVTCSVLVDDGGILLDKITLYKPVNDTWDAVNKNVYLELNKDFSGVIIQEPKVSTALLNQVKAIYSLEKEDFCALTYTQHGEIGTAIFNNPRRRIKKIEVLFPDGITVHTKCYNKMKGKGKPEMEQKVKQNFFCMLDVVVGKDKGGNTVIQQVPFMFWVFVIEESKRAINLDKLDELEEEDMIASAMSHMSTKDNAPDQHMSS